MTTSSGKKQLRSGYSTGACAAAAAKAAALLLLTGKTPAQVSIPFPDGSRHSFTLAHVALLGQNIQRRARVTLIKDAGDDPDVTNGAEIGAELCLLPHLTDTTDPVNLVNAPAGTLPLPAGTLHLIGGPGVGLVTKPGLPVAVGEAAINPVPRKMIQAAVSEALLEAQTDPKTTVLSKSGATELALRIFVRNGEALAEKTLNKRLGVLGGLSILGTTGIVHPVSAKAWTDTIEASMAVARAARLNAVLLSTGRTSEAAVQRLLQLPEEAQVMMGDYLHYALTAARRHGFTHVHLAGMWAKLIKAALAVPQTHVRNGALECGQAAGLLQRLGLAPAEAAELATANTAREIYEHLVATGKETLIRQVCLQAAIQAREWSGLVVNVYLITSEQGVVCHVTH